MTYDQWKDPTDYSDDPPVEMCAACAERAHEIYICAVEKARGLEAEVVRLKAMIAGAQVRFVNPMEDGYCGDGYHIGAEIVWPETLNTDRGMDVF